MQGKHWLVVVSLLILSTSGCRELSAEYCAAHYSTDSDCPQPGGPCESAGECSAPTPVCNADTMTCVECVESMQCALSRPICSAQNTCIECEKAADCESALCLEGGTCAAPADVAHVGGPTATDNSECSVALPCKTLQQALTPFRKYIKATGMITNPGVVTIDRQAVTIIGEPEMTTITRVDGGGMPVFEIKRDAVVTLVDLEIVGAADGHVVEIKDLPGPMVAMTRVKLHDTKDNVIQLSTGRLDLNDSQVSTATLVGINVTGGSLVMSKSQVFNNTLEGVKATGGTIDIRSSSIYLNKGTAGVFAMGADNVTIESSIITRNTGMSGGASISGPLTIRNSIISGNGDTATVVGGLTLNSGSATFEFNTVADNVSNVNPDVGMLCTNPLNVSNSIFTGNVVNGCNVTWSLADTLLLGDGNKMGAPVFLNTDTANPTSPMFYRIGPASAAKDSADPGAMLDVDIDGRPRMGMRDMGADEIN